LSTDPSRPPRKDAVLKNLPEERQAAILEMLAGKGCKATREWLAQEGIKTSASALSEFSCWHRLVQRYKQRDSIVAGMQARHREKHPDVSEEDLFAMGQELFCAMALADGDAENWRKIQSLRQSEASLKLGARRTKMLEQRVKIAGEAFKLAREKFEFEAAKAVRENMASLKSIAGRSDLDDDAKLEQIRLKLFGKAPQ
jgi:hypothetical protein